MGLMGHEVVCAEAGNSNQRFGSWATSLANEPLMEGGSEGRALPCCSLCMMGLDL